MIAAIAPPADRPATNDRLSAIPSSERSSRVIPAMMHTAERHFDSPDHALGLKPLAHNRRERRSGEAPLSIALGGGRTWLDEPGGKARLGCQHNAEHTFVFAKNAVVGNGHLDRVGRSSEKPFEMTTLATKIRDMLER